MKTEKTCTEINFKEITINTLVVTATVLIWADFNFLLAAAFNENFWWMFIVNTLLMVLLLRYRSKQC